MTVEIFHPKAPAIFYFITCLPSCFNLCNTYTLLIPYLQLTYTLVIPKLNLTYTLVVPYLYRSYTLLIFNLYLSYALLFRFFKPKISCLRPPGAKIQCFYAVTNYWPIKYVPHIIEPGLFSW